MFGMIFSDKLSHSLFFSWFYRFLFDLSNDYNQPRAMNEGPPRDIGGSGDWSRVTPRYSLIISIYFNRIFLVSFATSINTKNMNENEIDQFLRIQFYFE